MSNKFNFKKFLKDQGFQKEISAYSPRNSSEYFRINGKLAIVGVYFIYLNHESIEIPKTEKDAHELIQKYFPNENL